MYNIIIKCKDKEEAKIFINEIKKRICIDDMLKENINCNLKCRECFKRFNIKIGDKK